MRAFSLTPVAYLLTLGAIVTLGACGEAPADTTLQTTGSAQMALWQHEDGVLLEPGVDVATQNESKECADIWEKIHAHRKAVSETQEWKTLVATPQWQQVKADGKHLGELGCKLGDKNPSDACKAGIEKIRADFKIAQGTEAYKAASATPIWKELAKNYDEARAAGCLKSQQKDG